MWIGSFSDRQSANIRITLAGSISYAIGPNQRSAHFGHTCRHSRPRAMFLRTRTRPTCHIPLFRPIHTGLDDHKAREISFINRVSITSPHSQPTIPTTEVLTTPSVQYHTLVFPHSASLSCIPPFLILIRHSHAFHLSFPSNSRHCRRRRRHNITRRATSKVVVRITIRAFRCPSCGVYRIWIT